MKTVCLDIGTKYTRLCADGKYSVMPTVASVTVDKDADHPLLTAGSDALSLLQRVPGGTTLLQPVRCGVIADTPSAEELLDMMFAELGIRSPRVVAAVPCEASDGEKQTFIDVIRAAGAVEVALIEAPVAAAVGCGFDIDGVNPIAIADLGGGICEPAVIRSLGYLSALTLRIGGQDFDLAVQRYAADSLGLDISEEDAETFRLEHISLDPERLEDETPLTIRGNDLIFRLPNRAEADRTELLRAVFPAVAAIGRAFDAMLDGLRDEERAAVKEICLVGGLAEMEGLGDYIGEKTGLKVIRGETIDSSAPSPVVCGLREIAELPRWRKLLEFV